MPTPYYTGVARQRSVSAIPTDASLQAGEPLREGLLMRRCEDSSPASQRQCRGQIPVGRRATPGASI